MATSALEEAQGPLSAVRGMATVRLAWAATSIGQWIGQWHAQIKALAGFLLLACQRRGLDALPVELLMNLDDVLIAVLVL